MIQPVVRLMQRGVDLFGEINQQSEKHSKHCHDVAFLQSELGKRVSLKTMSLQRIMLRYLVRDLMHRYRN
jgi:translation initiation factor 2 beta subunit (eIF-2beta)/eIF-5